MEANASKSSASGPPSTRRSFGDPDDEKDNGLKLSTNATDEAKEQADERLRSVLGQLEEMGADPAGEVGADDPLVAFDDAVAQFSPTHLLIGLRDEDRAGWQERGLLEELHERLRIPITIFDVPAV